MKRRADGRPVAARIAIAAVFVACIVLLAVLYRLYRQQDAQRQAEVEQAAAAYNEALAAELDAKEQAEALAQGAYSAYEKLAVGTDVNILIAGDSISTCYGLDTSDAAAHTWYTLLGDYLTKTYMQGSTYAGSVKLQHLGLIDSGSYAGYLRTEILDDGTDYDLVILCYGAYDDPAVLPLYYEALIRSVLQKYPDCSIIAVLESALQDDPEKQTAILELCTWYEIPVVDMAAAFADSGYDMDALTGEDGILPTAAGYDLYYEAICAVIDENVAAGTGKTELQEPYDSAVTGLEQFSIYLEDGADGLTRTDALTWTLSISGTGLPGVGFYCVAGENAVDIYIDGAFYTTVTVVSTLEDSTLKTIQPLDETVTIEEEISMVFASEADADRFYCFAWSTE